MEEVIKYFESLEARLAATETRAAASEARIAEYASRIAALEEAQQTNEAVIASLEAEIEELKIAPVKEVRDTVIPKPRDTEEPEPEAEEEEQHLTPTLSQGEGEKTQNQRIEEVASPKEEVASPKAAIYGKAVEDIRQAISLGDRFLYQRELFGQKAELMQKTLDELNALSSFDEALAYINAHFQWDTESNTYQQFLVTLHRRFG